MAALAQAIDGEDRDAIGGGVEDLEKATRDFAERRMDRGIRQALQGRGVDEVAPAAEPQQRT